MKRVSSVEEAKCLILEIQQILKEKDSSFGFVLEFAKNGDFTFTTRKGYSFELRDKCKKPVRKIFSGKDVVDAVNQFVDFFLENGEGKISLDEDGHQFNAQFHFANKWVVTNAYSGSYHYTVSFDD